MPFHNVKYNLLSVGFAAVWLLVMLVVTLQAVVVVVELVVVVVRTLSRRITLISLSTMSDEIRSVGSLSSFK